MVGASGALFLIMLVAFTHQGKTAIMALLLVPSILPNPPSRPLEALTAPPLQEEVFYPYDARPVRAILYRPRDERRHSAVIFVLGVTPNLEDPTFVRVAEGLARMGIVVMVPDSEELRAGRMVPEEVDSLVAAFQYLQTQPFVDARRVGMGGFCVGASLVALAAEDERINREVAFLNLFGPYYDALDLVKAIAGRRFRYGDQVSPWQPHGLTLEVFTNHLIDSVESPQGRELLRKLLVEEEKLPPEAAEDLLPEGRLVYDLLTVQDPQQVDALVRKLPARTRENLRLLSPSSRIDQLKTKTFIMHDEDDTYIPYVESRRFAEGAINVSEKTYTQFTMFEHMRPQENAGNPFTFLREVVKLSFHLYRVLLQAT